MLLNETIAKQAALSAVRANVQHAVKHDTSHASKPVELVDSSRGETKKLCLANLIHESLRDWLINMDLCG